MQVKPRYVWATLGGLFFLGVFSTYQSNQSGEVAQSTPSASSSPLPSRPAHPSISEPTTQPTPAPTVTVTAPPTDACLRAAHYAVQMKDLVYETSSKYGDMRMTLDDAVKAMGMNKRAELSKQLDKLQDQDNELNEPTRKLVDLEPLLDAALAECKNG